MYKKRAVIFMQPSFCIFLCILGRLDNNVWQCWMKNLEDEVEYVIPTWRRYHRQFLFSLICTGLIALMIGNASFSQVRKNIRLSAQKPMQIEAVPIPAAEAKPVRAKFTTYTVIDGDNLESIARKFSIDVDTLLGANPELSRDVIYPDQQLVVLTEKGILHTIREGQTLWSLARQYGIDWQRIQSANPELSADGLLPGQKILVPGAKARYDDNVSRGNWEPGFRWPTQGSISSPFGYRWGRLHAGIDIAADTGNPIYTAQGGRVVFAGWKGGYGLAVIVDHGRGWETLYGHADEIYVSYGQIIQSGQCIGAVGNTGYSTGPHLHFEVLYQGVPINPMKYLP
jgi:LysM repeat protein